MPSLVSKKHKESKEIVGIPKELQMKIKKLENDIALIEAELQRIADHFGLKKWNELDKLFIEKKYDNSELDMLWPKYLYLRRKLDLLIKHKKAIMERLKKKS